LLLLRQQYIWKNNSAAAAEMAWCNPVHVVGAAIVESSCYSTFIPPSSFLFVIRMKLGWCPVMEHQKLSVMQKTRSIKKVQLTEKMLAQL
jgi:hypothetical protein